MSTHKAQSCDTFVALPPCTRGGAVVFGKNSDRPCDEVQEVVHVPAQTYDIVDKTKCTYIEIDAAPVTYACVLSKPSWMWGAEMGANEHGVCIGNEAVWTKLNSDDDLVKRLIGMDLVRLGLERGKTAAEALDVVTDLLATHGQGGPCAEGQEWSYHNSFIIADRKEAWVLETARKHWAAQRITSGYRNISNQLSIRTQIDRHSPGLIEFARSEGLFAGDGEFDFAKVFSSDDPDSVLTTDDSPSNRYQWGCKLLKQFSQNDDFSTQDMFRILRHEESEICRSGSITTVGSQVSVLSANGDDAGAALAVHWFTATPYPHRSLFKPFVFCREARLGEATVSAAGGADRKHKLYAQHQKFVKALLTGDSKAQCLLDTLREMEAKCVEDVDEMLANIESDNHGKLKHIFQHMAQLEINFYSM